MSWAELFNVTINDISVIYVTAHTCRCAGGLKLDLQSDSQRNRHLEGFFNMPVQALTRGDPFYTVIPRNRPTLSPFTTHRGYGGHILDLTPGVLTGGYLITKWKYKNIFDFHSPTPPSPSRRCHGDVQASLRRWRGILLLNMSIGEFVDWHVGRYVGKSVSPQTAIYNWRTRLINFVHWLQYGDDPYRSAG